MNSGAGCGCQSRWDRGGSVLERLKPECLFRRCVRYPPGDEVRRIYRDWNCVRIKHTVAEGAALVGFVGAALLAVTAALVSPCMIIIGENLIFNAG
jgi:hypothetical protein